MRIVSLCFLTVLTLGCAQSRAARALPAQASVQPSKTTQAGAGAAALTRLMSLVGTWDAPLGGGVLTDIFRPMAKGTALVQEEWYGGKQATATVFYLVDGELRADHFCDLGNQPRYAARSFTGSTIEFAMRDATGLGEHPRHFASVTFHFIDADHHTQVWPVVENGTPVKLYTLEFTRRASEALENAEP